MEREVTCEEYMAFLEDPATRAEIQAADRPIRFPRSGADAHAGGAWRDPATGGWRLPPGFAPDFPVLGVSFEDAQAHARWRSAREGRPYRLPTRAQWLMAGEGALAHRAYAFGDVFSPRWAKTCFARPRAFIEATMAYPTDESPLGVYDMTGSAAEWLDAWYDEPRKLRWLGGQGWGQAKAETFKLWSGFGLEATVAYYETGFRLVLLPEAPP
jgi:formylglycine-generating enzyme required for sulfatase activity